MSYVSVSAEVEVDVDDVIERLTQREVAELFKRHMPKQGVSVPPGVGEGDNARANTIIERAYIAARQMADLPREVADLFWHVHGRAI